MFYGVASSFTHVYYIEYVATKVGSTGIYIYIPDLFSHTLNQLVQEQA